MFAVQGDAGAVTAIASGISFDDHGDHGDHGEAPKLTGEIAGQKPSHLVDHDGEFAAFFDGEGVARIISEKAVLEGKSDFREVKTDAAAARRRSRLWLPCASIGTEQGKTRRASDRDQDR